MSFRNAAHSIAVDKISENVNTSADQSYLDYVQGMTLMLFTTAFAAQELLGEAIPTPVSRVDVRRVGWAARTAILLKFAAPFVCDHFCEVFIR
jgi:hypothetical protein